MRQNFEMTEADLKEILEACKPVPVMWIGTGEPKMPKSPQENANEAWQRLGKKMGFNYMTVVPTGTGDRFFTAEPTKD